MKTSIPKTIRFTASALGIALAGAALSQWPALAQGGHSNQHEADSAAHKGHDPVLHAEHMSAPNSGSAERQSEIARRSAEIMPFDLERTMHVFEPTPNGGVQTVFSKDNDAGQIALIRSHLAEIAATFQRGDFAMPGAIHGAAMPGLAELSAAGGDLRLTFEQIPNGARILYTGSSPQLVDAIHRWFAAQVSDHGRHATASHGSSH